MMADSPISDSRLAQKFQTAYEFYSDFAQHIADLHASLSVHDEPSRAAFSSLSRLMAFADQMSLLLNLMQEDVRVAGDLTEPPVNPNWADQIEQSFLEWLRSPKADAPRLN